VSTVNTNSALSDLDNAKQQVSKMVKSMNPELVCKLPTETTNGFFQIAISNKTKTVCLSLSEDDLFDFIEDPSRMKQIRGQTEQLIRDLRSGVR
jgi:hypothetical protein